MEQITLRYYDNAGVLHSQLFDALRIYGLAEPDKVRLVPATIYRKVDGSKKTAFKGFKRIITLELRSLATLETFLLNFLKANQSLLSYTDPIYGNYNTYVVFEGKGFQNEWVSGSKNMKKYKFELVETTMRTAWVFAPPSYSYLKIDSTHYLKIDSVHYLRI